MNSVFARVQKEDVYLHPDLQFKTHTPLLTAISPKHLDTDDCEENTTNLQWTTNGPAFAVSSSLLMTCMNSRSTSGLSGTPLSGHSMKWNNLIVLFCWPWFNRKRQVREQEPSRRQDFKIKYETDVEQVIHRNTNWTQLSAQKRI